MNKIFCFYIKNQPIIVQCMSDKYYYFDFQCIYPFEGVASTFYSEGYNFQEDYISVKVILENIFWAYNYLSEQTKIFTKENMGDTSKYFGREEFIRRHMWYIEHYLKPVDRTMLSKELIEDIKNNFYNVYARKPLTFFDSRNKSLEEPVLQIFRILYESRYNHICIFHKSEVLFDIETFHRQINYVASNEWTGRLRKLITDYYFSENQNLANVESERVKRFNSLNNQTKLELFQSITTTSRVTYYDDLLKRWWQLRY